ncbi:akirin-2 isoform X2 [Egretta garzetta]|uniref:akirin-2 isoform X2 n=1 Tax=Egretta garzetta TaxID=188379 RepID=UPI00163CE320|nr:akirin-2 isoform X2 [Egretta garzetta]
MSGCSAEVWICVLCVQGKKKSPLQLLQLNSFCCCVWYSLLYRSWPRLPLVLPSKQILYNIKQEYKRMQKRRHLENSFQQTDPCCSTDAQPHAFLLTGPALPASSPLKKEQPLFTLRQVGMICERLLKEREEKIREEYEEILTTKLAEQYDAFVKFTHDQIMRRYGEQPASYVS